MPFLNQKLKRFAKANDMLGKGGLSVALHITRLARESGLPLDAAELLTANSGQVKGLGKGRIQKILQEHGVERVLAEEGGRTSRGSVGKMQAYVDLLNGVDTQDLAAVEEWWVGRVADYFRSEPFRLRYDTSLSLRSVVADVIAQAFKRQAQAPGATYVGAVLQHLVGAKLDLLLADGVEHHGASVSDSMTGRAADFMVEDVAVHVTVTPGEALMRKCSENLKAAKRPLILTLGKGVAAAEVLAEKEGIAKRVDVFDAEQFIAGNLYELGHFKASGRRNTVNNIIERYNQIVDECETDPGLKITL